MNKPRFTEPPDHYTRMAETKMAVANYHSARLIDEEIELGNIQMPFGKYCGKTFDEIPLRYLDDTISPMPNTWLVRQARRFVDLWMSKYVIEGTSITTVPSLSSDRIYEQMDKARKTVHPVDQ